MGRPLADEPKSETVNIRLTVAERQQLDRDRGSKSITEYIRGRLFSRR